MRRRTRGIFIWEVIAAIILLSAVTLLLLTSMHTRHQVDARLDARLAAMDAAQRALLDRQAGKLNAVAGAGAGDVHLESRILDTPAIPGRQWLAIRATASGAEVELIGLVPAATEPSTAKGAGAP